MKIKINGIEVIFKDEFLVEDFEKVKLPPIDLTKMAKGQIETEDMNRLIPWLHKWLKIMAGNEASLNVITKITMPQLFDLVKDLKFMEFMKRSIGADTL